LKKILPLVPVYEEFREPFVGGGSVFVALKQAHPTKSYWINDLNMDLYLFWKYAQENIDGLVSEVQSVKEKWIDGRALFESYKGNWNELCDFDRAVRFFIMNRITFSGTVDSGGYSKQAFEKRLTDSSIDRLSSLGYVLDNNKITNLDYHYVVQEPGQEVFIFLDPPYYSTTRSRLYGKKGDLHETFDHEAFARNMRQCEHRWLITYDDCPEVRELFEFANIATWSLQYGMNNYKQGAAERGKELFIANYPIEAAHLYK